MILRDPTPERIAEYWRQLDERKNRHAARLIARLERLLEDRPMRCWICGASSGEARQERCKGACDGLSVSDDPVIRGMIRDGVPIDRTNYLNRAFGATPPDDWGPELESGLPEELRRQ